MRSNTNSAATGYAPPVPKPRFMPAFYAFLLSSATVILILMVFMEPSAVPVRGPRAPAAPMPAFALALPALLAAYLLLWIGYCGWRNRRGFRAWGWGRRILTGLRIVLQPMFWFLLMLIPWGLLLAPPGHRVTVRDKLAETVLSASSVQTAVTGRAYRNRTLNGSGKGLELTPGERITTGLVGRDGAVVVYDGEFGMLAVLLPSMDVDGKQVTWSCGGMPPKSSPRFCRDAGGETSFALRTSGSPREDALALLERAAAWQRQVESSALARGTLEGSAPMTIVRRDGLTDFALLDSNGRMALYSDRHGTFALLEPTLEKGKVSWRCQIWPATAASTACAPGR